MIFFECRHINKSLNLQQVRVTLTVDLVLLSRAVDLGTAVIEIIQQQIKATAARCTLRKKYVFVALPQNNF
jgi:hypothetical protein